MLNLLGLLVADDDPILERPPPDTPHAALDHAKMCFEALIRLYYLRHGSEAASIFFVHFLQFISFTYTATLKNLTFSTATSSADDVRAALILAAKCLSDQGRNYYVSETIYYAVQSQMDSEDAELMSKFVNARKEDIEARQRRARHLQSHIPAEIVKITGHPENKLLSNLMKQYAGTSPVEPSDTEL